MLLIQEQADVSDHMDFALTSLDMFAGISENLINYAFNVSVGMIAGNWFVDTYLRSLLTR